MTCNEDIEIPAFAEVALSSFSCTPANRTAFYDDGVVYYQVTPGGIVHELDLGPDEVNQDTLELTLRRYERLINSVLVSLPLSFSQKSECVVCVWICVHNTILFFRLFSFDSSIYTKKRGREEEREPSKLPSFPTTLGEDGRVEGDWHSPLDNTSPGPRGP
jgi:hypothetical protein